MNDPQISNNIATLLALGVIALIILAGSITGPV